MISECHIRTDHGSCADPDSVLDRDGPEDQVEGRLFVIVISRAEVGTLGKTVVTSDLDRRQIIDPGASADPSEVADFQKPGIFDVDARLNEDAPADLGSEEAQEERFEPIGIGHSAHEKNHIDKVPD
jgi:hypothetical protein